MGFGPPQRWVISFCLGPPVVPFYPLVEHFMVVGAHVTSLLVV